MKLLNIYIYFIEVVAQTGKNLPTMQEIEPRVQSWGREDALRREWQPTPVFLPGKFHGQRSLVSYSLWGHRELDTTQRLIHTHTHTQLT